MVSKRKFKRDYIILEAKDMNFRSKERVLPKAFAKIEINDEKSVVALYVENLKNLKDGYDVIALRTDYERLNLGRINLNSQGKGEFVLDLNEEDSDIKAIALTYEKYVPLIGFKGNKIENYEELIFEPEEEIIEYVEADEEDDRSDYEVYEEVEYIDPENGGYEYEEIEYIENDEEDDEYEYEEVIYEEVEDDDIENDDEEDAQEEEPIETPAQGRKSAKLRNDDYIEKKINKAKSVLEKQYTKNTYTPDKTSKEQHKSAGALLMPRQIKKGLKYFREVKPFVSDYIDNTRWWKIEINPTTMCGYTMPYLGYINSLNYTMYSDAVMQSYKYRHYLFGVQYDEYNKRKNYIYAIPGKKSEQPDKGTTGFTTYQACDNRSSSLGYWMCFIDSKARKIEK